MNTFLPYPDFERSVRCLDRQRLGRQRVEAWQIQRALLGISGAWVRHPAARMWEGHVQLLGEYGDACIEEWKRRGYVNNLVMYNGADALLRGMPDRPGLPSWLGDPRFHASQRSNLLRKAPIFYAQYGWSEPRDLPYFWPV